ncbi:hypothetical protein QJQ45_009165 [Haematococcus lacustris]|nr:hypothetical protein QJQ45_009165 [Haematococcus lacustris]
MIPVSLRSAAAGFGLKLFIAALGAAAAEAGQQVQDSVRSVQEAAGYQGPPALPTGSLVAGYALGAAAAGAGQQVQDSVRSVHEAAGYQGPPALPTGLLVAGLSGRLLRLVSTLDALPSLVTLCTVEGQVRDSCLR